MSPAPRVILITGPSGAGKTVLSNAIATVLGQSNCTCLSLDDYYLDFHRIPTGERDAVNFDHPDAIDWSLVLSHVSALRERRPIEKPCYDFVTHRRLSSTEMIHPLPYTIVDGIHAMARDALVSEARLTVYVDASREVCLSRRIARDAVERGRSEISVRNQFEETVWPMAERFVLPMRPRADVVASTDGALDSAVQEIVRHVLT